MSLLDAEQPIHHGSLLAPSHSFESDARIDALFDDLLDSTGVICTFIHANTAVAESSGSAGFAYYSAKDLVMSQEAGCGLMLWDGKSKGTLQNMLKLIGADSRRSFILRRPRIFTG